MNRRQIAQVVVILISLYLSYTLIKSLLELYQARDRVTTQQARLDEAKLANADLKKRLEEVRSLDFLEKEAREQLNMQLPGEVVIVIEGVKGDRRREQTRKEVKISNWSKWAKLFFGAS
jgi:cell division protein FtsB